MSKRRELKKYVRTVCGDLAGSILETAYVFNGVKNSDVCEIINEIAALQVETLAKAGVAYDKTPSTSDPAAYRKERRSYYHTAFRTLIHEFNASVLEIVKKINAAVPEDVRKQLKEAAK